MSRSEKCREAMQKRWAGRHEFWRELIERQQVSGLNITEFCAQEQQHPSSFHAWRTKLGMKPESVPEKKSTGFFEIAVMPESAPASCISIECADRITIHVHSHDGGVLRQVLTTVADVFGK